MAFVDQVQFQSRQVAPLLDGAARPVPTSMAAPQPIPCKADERGICLCCDTVVDRGQFFAFYPDAPDTDWRPWMTEPVEDAPRVITWDLRW